MSSSPPPSSSPAPQAPEPHTWLSDQHHATDERQLDVFSNAIQKYEKKYAKVPKSAWSVYSESPNERKREATEIREATLRHERECEAHEKEHERLKEIAKLKKITIRESSEATAAAVQSLKTFLQAYPSTALDFQSAGIDIGSLTREEAEKFLQLLEEGQTTIGRYKTANAELKARNAKLVERNAELEKEPIPTQQLFAASEPSLEVHRVQRDELGYLAMLPFPVTSEDWPVNEIDMVLQVHKRLRDENITPRAEEWLRISITRATNTDRSAREQAAWLFFKGRLQMGAWSHADLQALVIRARTATLESLQVVIAFLYAFMEYKINELVGKVQNLSFDDSLVLLRLLEFLMLHLTPQSSSLSNEVIPLYRVLKPLVETSARDRRIISALVLCLDDLCEYRISSLASCIIQECDTSGEQGLLPDGTNLVVSQGNHVRYLRRCHFTLHTHYWVGYKLRLSPFPEEGEFTYTPVWPYAPETVAMIREQFPDAYARAKETSYNYGPGNTSVTSHINLDFQVSV
ncbi:hypothetical protein ABEF95_002050 [Exophiala dermatitidis]|uniref:Uncharacterized protein n=1 Tax=Exophiala dermatitidis (strain ATCC 34100 / CBS 525.76 / NIH/UT8656) TaxID=858893 RepID=H6C7K7_EXODN|nr:uncharacterized protein HMPREF1120_06839 [Exophiala dermatitidis NIH/UT8656]EHY58837.1 hypothetical protein HMPREF1120_06839 [Exophiala dermatitidis NIH/UT8656]